MSMHFLLRWHADVQFTTATLVRMVVHPFYSRNATFMVLLWQSTRSETKRMKDFWTKFMTLDTVVENFKFWCCCFAWPHETWRRLLNWNFCHNINDGGDFRDKYRYTAVILTKTGALEIILWGLFCSVLAC